MMSKTGRNKTLLPKYKWVWSLCLGLFATLVVGGIIRNTKADSISFPNLTYDQSEVMTVITTIDKFDSAPRNHGNAAMHQGHLAIIFSGGGENIDGGFAFYDMTDPYNPVLVKQLDNEQTQDIREAHGYGFSHHNNGQYVALQAANGIQIWDWTDIQNPTRLSYLALPGIEASDYALGAWWLFWQAPYIYVGGSSNGIYIIDATDPANPILVDRGAQPNPIPTSQTGGFRIGPVFAIGNLLVATTMSGTGYATFDISEPTNPTLLTTNSGAGYPPNYSTMVNGNKIYIAGSNDHFHIMDITDPTQIIEQGSVATGDKGGYVTIQDGFAHAGVSNHYVKIDVQDPNNPTIVGTASSGITGRDEDFATVLGNLVIIGDDHSKGSFVVPHQAAPDTIGPVVNMVNPADGATNQATTTRIGLTFSDVVDLRTVDNTTVVIRPLNGSPLTGQYSGQTGIVNFHPDTPLQPDTTYQIEILAGGVKDVVGNTVGTTFTAQFSTGSSLANPPACTINPTTPSEVNSVATFSTSLLQGSNVTYSYDFGDGSTSTPFVTDNTATHTYTQTGHFPIQVTVTDGLNSSSCAALQTIYNPVTAVPPTASSTIILDQDGSKVWNVNPDNGTVTAVSTTDYAKAWETPVGTHPRTLAQAANGDIWVTNQDDASISILDSSTGAVINTITLPYASQPYAIVFAPNGSSAFVTLQATGQLIAIDPTTLAITGTLDVGATPRGIAITNDSSSLFVTRFISPDTHGEVTEIDLATFTATRIIELAFDPGPDTESSARGVPNGLGSPTISPDGLRLWIPSKKDNIARGLYRDGLGLTFETTVRTITSQIDLSSNSEVLSGRHDYDNRDRAIAVAFSALGDYAFVALQGSNAVEVVDTTSGNLITAIEGIGLAPQGLTFSQDGNTLFVHSFLSRSVLAYDVSEIVTAGSQTAVQLANTITVATEQFTPDVLLGKQIFYNAADNRMNQEGYLACASCHLDDGGDGRIWDRGADGEGFRNTISLIGVGGMEQGRVHFSANFDEIQDFEHDMRQLFGGTGFLTDAQFNSNNTNHPLGDAKAGLNAELDALATYVASLNQFPLSPYRNSNGTLTADAEAGKLLFASLDCATCHSGTHFTDSPSGIRHDVGTILSTSGQRLTLPLLGFDTPTLRNLWQTAPYLHDGSAPTLDGVFTTRNPDDLHGETAVLTQTERDQLVAYLLQIDRLEPAQPDSTPAILLTAPLHNATFATNVVIDLETAVTTTLGTISSVEFYADSTLIGTDSTAPYTFTWSSAEVGQHFLIARAIHDNGNRTISNELRLLIEDGVPTPTPLPTATPTTIPSGGTLFSDDFNRANSTIVGNGWLEIEDSGTAVDILDNQLCFTESSNEPNSPIVTHSFAPTTSGELTFAFDFDWQRTGTDRAYRVFMQLGDGSLMNENSWDDGVGVNVLWSAISRVHETLGYRQGGSNHSLTTVSGTAHIEITANLDTNTFDITVDETLVGTSLPFDNLVAFDTVRFFSDRMLDSDFAGRCFDNVSITQPGAPVPTATATFTAVPTSTATPLPTNTTTPAATSTPLPTATTTAVPTSTATPAATNTPTIIPTSTVTAVSTSTPTPAPTTTSTPIPTNTPTPLPTNTPMPTPTDTPGGNSMHVADIDGLAISLGSRWDAIMTVTIVDDTGQAMAGAMVTGTFAFNGRSRTYSCDTEPNGICDIQLTGLKNNITSVTFTIDNVVGTLPYLSSNNTDPDGDSDGTTFTLPRP